MNKKYFIGAFSFLIALALIWNVSASCIMPGSVEEEFARADAVFEGTVMKVEDFDDMNNLVTFDVEIPVWKGGEFLPPVSLNFVGNNNEPITISIIVPKAGKVSIGYDYEINERYIVYAYDSDENGQLETNLCTRANLNAVDYSREKAELEILFSLEFGRAVKGEVEIVEEFPSENDDYNLAVMEIKGDYLEVIATYGGGCEEHEFTLFADSDIEGEYSAQQNIYLIHDNNGDACEALETEKIIFDLTPLKKQFEVCPTCVNCDEPCAYTIDELALNLYIYDYSNKGKNIALTYNFGENEDGKIVEPVEDVEDVEPTTEQSTIKKFFSWIRGIFS